MQNILKDKSLTQNKNSFWNKLVPLLYLTETGHWYVLTYCVWRPKTTNNKSKVTFQKTIYSNILQKDSLKLKMHPSVAKLACKYKFVNAILLINYHLESMQYCVYSKQLKYKLFDEDDSLLYRYTRRFWIVYWNQLRILKTKNYVKCDSSCIFNIHVSKTGCKAFYFCVYSPRLYVFLFFLFSLSSFSDICLAKAHTILSFSVSRLFEAHKTIQIITAMISSTVATTCYKRIGWYIEWLWWVQLCFLSITSDIFQPPDISNTI